MEPVDRKFVIQAVSLEHDTEHTHADAVLFLAKDRAFLATLPSYREFCEFYGADARQLEGVDRLIARVARYQREHPELVKVARRRRGARGRRDHRGPNEGP